MITIWCRGRFRKSTTTWKAGRHSYEYPQMNGTYNGRHYLTAYSKEQHDRVSTTIIIDHDADGTPAHSGIVSFENGIATLGDEGSATYTFTVSDTRRNLRYGHPALLSLLG
jgi:hypothetical protein